MQYIIIDFVHTYILVAVGIHMELNIYCCNDYFLFYNNLLNIKSAAVNLKRLVNFRVQSCKKTVLDT